MIKSVKQSIFFEAMKIITIERMKKIILSVMMMIMGLSLFAEDTRPNILFILTDDMGYSDVGFNQVENSPVVDIVTPNLDQLAEDGTIFESAYAVHMFCGPSRAGLMTGRYPHKLGSQFNLAAFSEFGVDTSEVFVSEVLHDAGYYTSIIGKWHLGEEEQYHPNNRGFDHFYGFLGGGHKYFSNDWFSISQTEAKFETAADGSFAEYSVALMRNEELLEKPSQNLYLTDMLTSEGVSVLDSAQNAGKPFFLFMSYNAPHTLLEAKAADIAALKTSPYNIDFNGDEDRATYSAMMYALDKQVKVLIDALKAKGMYDNTLIVFMSDNGGKLNNNASANNHPLKGGKGDIDEGGIRVPMFMHWPSGMSAAPKVFEHVVSGLDLYPTFVEIAHATMPEDIDLDGKDIFSEVLENTDPRPDEAIFNLNVKTPNNYVQARKGKYKAKTFGDGTWVLYDLEADITESTTVNDVAILKELTAEAEAWARTHVTPTWFDNPDWGWEQKWAANNMPNWERTFPDNIGELPEGLDGISLQWKDGKTDDRKIEQGAEEILSFTYSSGLATKAYLIAESKTGGSWGDLWYSKEIDLVSGLGNTIDIPLVVPQDQETNAGVRVYVASENNGGWAKRLLPAQVVYMDIVSGSGNTGGDGLAISQLTWSDGSKQGVTVNAGASTSAVVTYSGASSDDVLYLRVACKDNWGTFWATERVTFPQEAGEVSVTFTMRDYNTSVADANTVRAILSASETGVWSDRVDVLADASYGNDAIYGTIAEGTSAVVNNSIHLISVYPNPSNEEFHFRLVAAADVIVRDMMGRIVKRQKGMVGLNSLSIDKAGMFILTITDDLTTLSRVIVVKD